MIALTYRPNQNLNATSRTCSQMEEYPKQQISFQGHTHKKARLPTNHQTEHCMEGNRKNEDWKWKKLKVIKETTSAILLLADYLLDDVGLDYVLSGKVQSDWNKLFCRRKVLPWGLKSIRVKSLIKFSE